MVKIEVICLLLSTLLTVSLTCMLGLNIAIQVYCCIYSLFCELQQNFRALTIHLGLHSTISWTQGGLYVQLALKYWPSTRDVLENSMAISADFHGSLFELPCMSPARYAIRLLSSRDLNPI
jgi:hypothetical protein